MANPRIFTNLIVQLLKQRRRRKYYKDKNNGNVRKSMSIYGGVGKCHKKNYGFFRSFAIESSSPHPHKAIDFQTQSDNICGNICGILLNSTQALSQSLAEKVLVLVYSVISLYANKYPPL